MKILHVITSLRTGGAEKLMLDLIPRLKDYGHEVDLLIFDGTSTPFRKQAEDLGIKVLDLGKGGSVYSPKRLLRLRPFLKHYDIIHTHNTACQLFAAIANIGRKKALVTTEHSSNNRRRKIKFLKPIDRWMYNRYKVIINISQKAEDNLRTYLGHSNAKICTVNNGIDVAKFATAKPSEELEKLAPGSKKILMVAGFRSEKDQPTLIRSLKELPEDFHLFLVGDGERRTEFEELVKSLNLNERVHFLGIREDIPELLKVSDYVVLSSHYEGLSLSSVEGMAAGKPFLASDVEGLREVVKGSGILFKDQNERHLASLIQQLNNDPFYYEKISENCTKRAKDFDVNVMVKGYNDVYSKL